MTIGVQGWAHHSRVTSSGSDDCPSVLATTIATHDSLTVSMPVRPSLPRPSAPAVDELMRRALGGAGDVIPPLVPFDGLELER